MNIVEEKESFLDIPLIISKKKDVKKMEVIEDGEKYGYGSYSGSITVNHNNKIIKEFKIVEDNGKLAVNDSKIKSLNKTKRKTKNKIDLNKIEKTKIKRKWEASINSERLKYVKLVDLNNKQKLSGEILLREKYIKLKNDISFKLNGLKKNIDKKIKDFESGIKQNSYELSNGNDFVNYLDKIVDSLDNINNIL